MVMRNNRGRFSILVGYVEMNDTKNEKIQLRLINQT